MKSRVARGFLFAGLAAAAAAFLLARPAAGSGPPGRDLPRLALYLAVALGAIAAVHWLRTAVRFWRETEEAYRLVFEDASDGIAICTPDLRLVEANSRACEMLGYSREELLRMNVPDLIWPEDLVRVPLRFQDVLQEGRTVTEARRFRRKDGSLIAVEASVRRLRDGRLIAIGRDITERRRAEEALRQSETITRSLVYSAVDGIIIADQQGRIRVFNPAAEKLFGYTAEEALGNNLSMLMPPPYRDEHDRYIRDYLATGARKVIGIGRETIGRRKDGSTFPLELAVSEMKLPEGRMFTGIVRDISERKAAEEAIRQANETLRALIQASPLAIVTLDLEGAVRSWNATAQRIFGWSETEVLGRPVPLVPESDRGEFLRALERARQADAFSRVDQSALRRDGGTVEVSVWSALLLDREGNAGGLIAVAADVTERKRLEEQLIEAQKMEAVGRLAGGVAHDFNNVLTVITGYGQLLRKRLEAAAVPLDEVDEVLQSADHAAALTRQLLIFSRQQLVQPRVLDLNAVVARLDGMLRRIMGEDIELVKLAGEGLGPVCADAGQIEQVIVNLALNARDAMPRGGRLLIETANVELDENYARGHVGVKPGRYVMLAVSDSGVGMDAATRAHLFEPFFTTKETGKGSGLGLSTVYGIVKRSGGVIWVHSEPGKGTTFKIYLPRFEPAPAEAATPCRAGTAPPCAATILLAEDEGRVRRLVRELLESRGYRVLEAGDGLEALRVCQQHGEDIHLLLTDVVMPQISGRELADRARLLRPRLKVLFMSGYTDNVVLNHGIDALAASFLQKPFTPGRLVEKVREALDSAG